MCSGPAASEGPVLQDPGLGADHATGRSLQEVHGAAGQREVQPRQNGERTQGGVFGQLLHTININSVLTGLQLTIILAVHSSFHSFSD